jgi:hypothetical protein
MRAVCHRGSTGDGNIVLKSEQILVKAPYSTSSCDTHPRGNPGNKFHLVLPTLITSAAGLVLYPIHTW